MIRRTPPLDRDSADVTGATRNKLLLTRLTAVPFDSPPTKTYHPKPKSTPPYYIFLEKLRREGARK